MVIAIIAIAAALIAVVIVGRIERKELYDRLMAGTLDDYRSSGKPPKAPKTKAQRMREQWRETEE